jgi:hypothetical protein
MTDHGEHRLVKLQIGAGEPRNIPWPPNTEEEWGILAAYFNKQDEILHKMRRAIVALEKKVHWGMPTRPILRKRCVYTCKDRDGNDIDPTNPRDEGDGSGAGGNGNGGAQDEDIGWD